MAQQNAMLLSTLGRREKVSSATETETTSGNIRRMVKNEYPHSSKAEASRPYLEDQ
jgi:hypothetical protein